jgi:hypothetical protein
MAIKCRIWWLDSAQAYAITFAYKVDLVEKLKGVIPSGDRDYDPTSKTWYVKEQYGAAIRSLAEAAFGVGSVSFTSKQVAEQSRQASYSAGARGAYLQPGQGSTEDAVVAFMNLVPYDAAKRAYLLAAQQLHPDKHMDDPNAGSKMAKLNELWVRVEKEFYKR